MIYNEGDYVCDFVGPLGMPSEFCSMPEEELKEQELSNEKIFIDELRINLSGLEENMLYDDIYNDKDILKDVFEYLLKEEVMVEKELIKIFANHNNYIVGYEEKNKKVQEEVSKITKVINYSYRISKLNFIWKKKMEESKKNVSNQLEGVSEAISKLANEMNKKTDEYEEKKQLLADRLVAIYEQGRITFLDVLLASDNIWDYISMSSKVQQLTDADNEQMDKVEAQKNEVERAKKALEKEKKELAESKKSVQDKQAKVKVAKDKKEAKVANLTAEQKKLQTQINNYNKEIQKLEEELAKAANDYNNSYTGKFVGTLSWPLSKSSPGYKTITSYYGNRQVPIAGATSDHRAIDIGVPTGTPVLSAGNGIVISTGYNSARGYFVIIKHADNLYTLYQHLSKILVSRGQAVSTGKTIAKSGSSGIGTGPHLHFEVRKSQYYGSEVNPLDYCHW
mgnify:CR=1 FL=1